MNREPVPIHKRKPLTRAEFGQLMVDQEGKCACGCAEKLQPLGEGVIDEHRVAWRWRWNDDPEKWYYGLSVPEPDTYDNEIVETQPLYATPAQPDTGDVAASQRVIALIADVANAVGWQAGEPGMEIAGGLLSYLAAHPDKVEAFLSNPSDVMMSHNAHDGCLTWRTTKGEIINQEIYQERIAARDASVYAALSKPNAPGAPADGGA